MLAIISFVTAFASQRMGALMAIATTVGLTLFCIAVFHWGLGMPTQFFGPWMQALGLGN